MDHGSWIWIRGTGTVIQLLFFFWSGTSITVREPRDKYANTGIIVLVPFLLFPQLSGMCYI